jgi:hypothetical protein
LLLNKSALKGTALSKGIGFIPFYPNCTIFLYSCHPVGKFLQNLDIAGKEMLDK